MRRTRTLPRRPSRPLTWLAAFAIVLLAYVLYRSTMLPGLDMGDTPSFQVMGGSAFITPRDAYPLYFAIAAPFVWWSPGDPAHAMNLASVVEASATCGLVLLLAVELSGSIGAGLVAALLFGGSYTFWSQAIITEVYALHILCVSLVMLALFAWARRPTLARLSLVFALYAASFGNHLAMALLFPGIVLFLFIMSPGGVRAMVAPRVVAAALLCAAGGALLYAWNVRTMLIEPIPPATAIEAARSFWLDVTKADWREAMVLRLPGTMAAERLQMYLFDVHQQFGWLPLLAAAIGAGTLVWRAPAAACLLFAAFACTVAFALTYNVGDTHVFLIPAHLVLALLIAPGLALVTDAVAARTGRRVATSLLCLAFTLAALRIYAEYPALDRSMDRRGEAVLAQLTSGVDDRRSVLLADLNWQLLNGLNYYARHLRRDLAYGLISDILPHAPAFIRDNEAIGREVLLTRQAATRLTTAYGPLFRPAVDDRVVAERLARRVETVPQGAIYVFCLLKPTPDVTPDRKEADAAIARLTGSHLRIVPSGDYVAIAGIAGAAPQLVEASNRPFRVKTVLNGLPVLVRMDSWLTFDTIRRMGFGHVIAGRHHSLIVERGVSVVVLDDTGQPTRTEYADGLYAPQPRWRLPANQ